MPVRVWGWLEAFSFFRRCLLMKQLDLSLKLRPSHGTIGLGLKLDSRPDGRRFRLGRLDWVWKRKDQRCQFRFGGGSRPSVVFSGVLTISSLPSRFQGLLLCVNRRGLKLTWNSSRNLEGDSSRGFWLF